MSFSALSLVVGIGRIQFSKVNQINHSGMRLTTHRNELDLMHGKEEGTRVRQLRPLRRTVHKKTMVEQVLRSPMPLAGLGRKASTNKRKPFWGWTVSEIETLLLPSFSFGNPNCCAYCGDRASEKDHVIAVSYQSNSKKHRFTGNGPWCWACQDCNSHLSNRYFDGFKERCEWAHWRLEVKAKPIEWHGWELDPLEYGLRSHIRSDMERRKQYRFRADFYGSRDFYLNLESLVWEIAQLRSTGIGGKFLAAYFSSILRDVTEIYRT